MKNLRYLDSKDIRVLVYDKIVTQTEKAVLFYVTEYGTFWIPKSLIIHLGYDRVVVEGFCSITYRLSPECRPGLKKEEVVF